jgi:hypothetical protein
VQTAIVISTASVTVGKLLVKSQLETIERDRIARQAAQRYVACCNVLAKIKKMLQVLPKAEATCLKIILDIASNVTRCSHSCNLDINASISSV